MKEDCWIIFWRGVKINTIILVIAFKVFGGTQLEMKTIRDLLKPIL